MANVIITNLSKLKTYEKSKRVVRDAKKNTVIYDSDLGAISGVHTNDAPIKYLISRIEDDGECADKIIAVTTKQAIPTFKRLKKIIEKYGAEKNIDVSKCELELVLAGDTGIENTIDNVIRHIKSGDKVYIDTTGGFRNSSYILMAVVRILEYSGIHLKRAVYSNKEMKRIQNITDTYNMFNLINSANSFASFGNSKGLRGFFEDSQRPEIIELLNTMNAFSDSVALCRTSNLDSHLNALNDGLVKLQSMETNIKNEVLFKSISGVIRKKFSIGDKKKIDYFDVIKWCIENQLIQQAVTVYADKLGDYLFNTKKAFDALPTEVEKHNNENDSFDKYYKLFWKGLMTLEPECNYTAIELMLKKNEKTNIKEIIVDAKDINEFERKASYIKIDKNLREELTLLFRVKKAMYDVNGKKNSPKYAKNKLENFPDLIVMTDNPARTPEKFINSVINNKEYLRALSERYRKSVHYEDVHINTIEHFEDAYNNQKKTFGVAPFTINISIENMQKIMRDYLYIKNWLRNSINHASDNEEFSEGTEAEASKKKQEQIEYFDKYDYKIEGNPSLDEIVKVLRDAVKFIENI